MGKQLLVYMPVCLFLLGPFWTQTSCSHLTDRKKLAQRAQLNPPRTSSKREKLACFTRLSSKHTIDAFKDLVNYLSFIWPSGPLMFHAIIFLIVDCFLWSCWVHAPLGIELDLSFSSTCPYELGSLSSVSWISKQSSRHCLLARISGLTDLASHSNCSLAETPCYWWPSQL